MFWPFAATLLRPLAQRKCGAARVLFHQGPPEPSNFKAVNNRDKNFIPAKVERRRVQLEESVARHLSQLDTADRQEPSEALAVKVTRLRGI